MESVKKSIDERAQHKRQYDRRKQLIKKKNPWQVLGGKQTVLEVNIDSRFSLDYDSLMTKEYFAKYTGIKVKQFRDELIQHMENVKKFVAERTCHQRQYERRVNKRQMQTHEGKVDSSKAFDASLVVTECSGTKIRYDDNKSKLQIQQKKESFQSNKPCKNQDSPEFREFFKINELKAQLQAKNLTINNLKKQIKKVHEKSYEAKDKHDIDVLETINIELESSVAKLLAENEKLNKENEHLKQTYKELYDSIKKTLILMTDHNDSLIAQVNSKSVENAKLKAQIQEKVFANVALKNELRKLKGNSMDTKFAKPSILGKPVLQPPRNQSVVRQP
ncbi:hypothetical protein Tco_0896238, partial [Tanacetum coccineum]